MPRDEPDRALIVIPVLNPHSAITMKLSHYSVIVFLCVFAGCKARQQGPKGLADRQIMIVEIAKCRVEVSRQDSYEVDERGIRIGASTVVARLKNLGPQAIEIPFIKANALALDGDSRYAWIACGIADMDTLKRNAPEPPSRSKFISAQQGILQLEPGSERRIAFDGIINMSDAEGPLYVTSKSP